MPTKKRKKKFYGAKLDLLCLQGGEGDAKPTPHPLTVETGRRGRGSE